MATRNRFRVPTKQWKKWSEKARSVFNNVYRFMLNNPWAMTHPKAPGVKPDHWGTTCWNAAWLAADAVDESIPSEFVSSDGTTRKAA